MGLEELTRVEDEQIKADFGGNKKIPHQSIVTINIDTYERLPSGQVMPPPKTRYCKIYSVLGNSLEECQKKLNTFLKKNLPNLAKEKQNEQD